MKNEFNGLSDEGLLSEKKFRELAEIHDKHCISIYLPTYRAGSDSDNKRSQIRLKNLVKEVKNTLSEFSVKEKEINSLLKPVFSLQKDTSFWRNQSDGLAILLNSGDINVFTLPVHFEEYTYVGDHFYLKPIIPFFNDDGRFYLLTLSLKNIRFLECSRHFISEIYINDLIPARLEDAVGYDYRDKSLQFRTGKGGAAGVMFHGQGSGKDDKEEEVQKFFRAVDSGIMKILKNEDAPLVLACVDHYYPIYKMITEYQNVYYNHVSGNPDHADVLILHEKAWLIVEEHFKQLRKNKTKQFQDLSATKRTSFDIKEIIPSAIDGRVETLFLQQDKDIFGIYDKVNRNLEIVDSPDPYHTSLYNMAAVYTIKNGGRVYKTSSDLMPLKNSEINALFRY